MELVDDGLGRDTDGADEQFGTAVDYYVDELVELALRVVVAGNPLATFTSCVLENRYVLGLSRAATDLGEEQIDTEGRTLVVKEALQLGDLLAEHVWGVANATEHTKTSGVGDSGSELRACCYVHTGEQHRVLDLQQVGELCADLLYALSAGACEGWFDAAYEGMPWLELS